LRSETIVVVPCYNEARRLDLAAFAGFLDRVNDATILFVDDGSSDTTAEILERFAAERRGRVELVRLEQNRGKAEAVRQGMLAAWQRSPRFVGYWDADLATPLTAVTQFRELLMRRPDLSLVMGSRVATLGRQITRSWRRHVAGRAFATAASLTLGLVIYDTQCGSKMFRATPETELLFRRPFRSRWVFDVEILARLVALAGRDVAAKMVYECPLDLWTDVRGSQLRLGDFGRAAADLMRIYWHDVRGRALAAPVPADIAAHDVARPLPRKAA
jgi:glycosyltransferase involved in cell wall biosynthesis